MRTFGHGFAQAEMPVPMILGNTELGMVGMVGMWQWVARILWFDILQGRYNPKDE